MKTVRDVVSAVVGFNQERGDLITVESLPFAETVNQSVPEPLAPGQQSGDAPVKWNDWKHQPLFIPVAGAVGLIVLAGVVIVVMRGRGGKLSSSDIEVVRQLPGRSANAALDEADMTSQVEAQLAQRQLEKQRSDMAALASIKMPIVNTKKAEVLAKQLRDGAQKDPAPAGQILQTWIHERS